MYGLRETSFVTVAVLWTCILDGLKVGAYYNDGLNPVKVTLEVWRQRNPRVVARNTALTCEKPNIYICEEPMEVVSPEMTKTCNFRNQNYHEQVYRWVAGRGCLVYTPDFLYVGGVNTINLNAACLFGQHLAPCLEMPKEDGTCGCYPFDPGLEEVASAVRAALIPSAHGRWEACFYAAADCCSHYMGQENDAGSSSSVEIDDSIGCPATFDGWTCWPAAEPDSISNEVCSEFAYSGQGPSCHHFSSKECYGNSTWEVQTDYSTCSISPRLLRRYRFYIAVLAFSIAFCLPAVFVFFFYKRLRITRVSLHRNLLIAIIIRNVLVIVSRSEIYIDELTNAGETVMSAHTVACRVLAVAERVAGNAVFVAMLVEGVYLHRLIVAVFRKKMNIIWLYAIGAGIAIVPVVAWATVMGLHDDHSCWLVYTVEHIQWILDAPRLLVLLVNTILFIDVLRVLLTKIRNSENANQLSTAKATIFLMPIFGCQFLLTALRPNTDNCGWEQAYYYISYTVEGLQGVIVALLYCYANKEVHMLVKATYKKTESAVVSRVRGDSGYPRMSMGPNSDRRMTYSTGIPSHDDDLKDQYATVRPKLHVAEIISIQASERLAEILEPVYETIENTNTIEGYDSLDRSDVDNSSDFTSNRNSLDQYYGFTKASSISIDCTDWLRRNSSLRSSLYGNSMNEYENGYVSQQEQEGSENAPEKKAVPEYSNVNADDSNVTTEGEEANQSEYEDCETMLDEIIQYMESCESPNKLDPNLLCPYKKGTGDNIMFVD